MYYNIKYDQPIIANVTVTDAEKCIGEKPRARICLNIGFKSINISRRLATQENPRNEINQPKQKSMNRLNDNVFFIHEHKKNYHAE